jgi:hypothetical protein
MFPKKVLKFTVIVPTRASIAPWFRQFPQMCCC